MTYGTDTLIPCTYPTIPDGFTTDWAAPQGQRAAVLRDPDGTIVATWDEGRWWTPEESARFVEVLTSEIGGES